MKTGGGPPKEHNDPTVEEILALIGSELTPLTNMFDSDVQKGKFVCLSSYKNRFINLTKYVLANNIFSLKQAFIK